MESFDPSGQMQGGRLGRERYRSCLDKARPQRGPDTVGGSEPQRSSRVPHHSAW